MGTVCRCHGVSGSCQSKTCFRRLSDFKSVATVLKKRYDKVIFVISANKGKKYQTLKSRGGKPYSPVDLIALEASPNYCKKSQSRGTLGTAGRECNPKTTGKGSCAYMCCGRGFKTFTKEIEERCECQYYWCCYVKCKKCKKTITVSTCLWLKRRGAVSQTQRAIAQWRTSSKFSSLSYCCPYRDILTKTRDFSLKYARGWTTENRRG